jgi:hypothetical protein
MIGKRIHVSHPDPSFILLSLSMLFNFSKSQFLPLENVQLLPVALHFFLSRATPSFIDGKGEKAYL